MIIVRISGGLGNQLFQIGFANYLSEKKINKIKIDLSFYSDQKNIFYRWFLNLNKIPSRNFEFNSSLPFELCDFDDMCGVLLSGMNHNSKLFSIYKVFFRLITQFVPISLFLKVFSNKVINEKNIDLNKLGSDNLIYSGYWQNNAYFFNYEKKLKKNLYKVLFNNNCFNYDINYDFNNCIVLHVRKGDYLHINQYFDLDMVYYNNAINHIRKLNPSLKNIFIITNDTDWCLKNLKFDEYVVEFGNSKMNLYYDFSIIQKAKYIVTSNSTFCFWAAFLGEPIVATIPNLWYSEAEFGFIPDSWHKINCINKL